MVDFKWFLVVGFMDGCYFWYCYCYPFSSISFCLGWNVFLEVCWDNVIKYQLWCLYPTVFFPKTALLITQFSHHKIHPSTHHTPQWFSASVYCDAGARTGGFGTFPGSRRPLHPPLLTERPLRAHPQSVHRRFIPRCDWVMSIYSYLRWLMSGWLTLPWAFVWT